MEHLFSLTKKDFEITYFSGSGAGGQHRNKHQNCVRIKHKETGIIAVGQEHKSRKDNQEDAFNRLCNNPKFKIWLNKKSWEEIYKKDNHLSIEEAVEKEMKNIKIEVKQDDVWVLEEEKEKGK